MGALKDITGQRFGKLVAIERIPGFNKNAKWLFKCNCGNTTEKLYGTVRYGKAFDCGCSKHGFARHPLYDIWAGMIKRCTNMKCKSFPDYGGRGITVCDRWLDSPAHFIADMGGRPANHELERIDNNGPYSPENCRWATRMEQAANKRNNTMLPLGGETLHLSEWARRYGIAPHVISKRLKRGWTVEDAITKPLRKTR